MPAEDFERALLHKFGEVAEKMAASDETVAVSIVVSIIVETLSTISRRVQKENPFIKEFIQRLEMSLTTSLVFNVSLLTSLRDDVRSFMEKMEGSESEMFGACEKPN